MAIKKPLVNASGQLQELSAGDLIVDSYPRTLSYAAAITVDCSLSDTFDLTLAGNPTLTLTGAVDGQKILLRLKQDATGGRSVTWGSGVRFGTDITSVTLSTAAAKTDYVGLLYNAASATYDVISYVRGF